MEFGVFDHLDRNDSSLRSFYDERLELVELYDRYGFFCYHIAEHHFTPLGLAASPGIFLASVAQRTKRLRFGPLVYTLPMHQPLRLVEEICMLDQLSGGRFQLGVGKGISPIETAYFGLDPGSREERYLETLEVLKLGLTSETLTFKGKYFDFQDIPMELETIQKPHPPLWMGVASIRSAENAARNGANFVTLSTASQTREMTEAARAELGLAGSGEAAGIKMGLGRFVIVARTDDEAVAIARRAYPAWHSHFHHLYTMHGRSAVHGDRPPDFDQINDGGRGIAGSPETVVRMLADQISEAGVNYFVGQFIFGDLETRVAADSIGLFAREVMPELRSRLS
jgi:alkanesulfonate monooxygenase SsuD/methylene tetrahydromethanopterin reductase-like flavin-dependent oxidoreductase (luciferase family)